MDDVDLGYFHPQWNGMGGGWGVHTCLNKCGWVGLGCNGGKIEKGIECSHGKMDPVGTGPCVTFGLHRLINFLLSPWR